MRAAAGVALALLAAGACSQGAEAPPPDPDSLIECAIDSTAFARECTVERHVTDGALTLVVRHPDGGFRRFEVLTDGRGVATADGADLAQVRLADGGIEVTVGEDRYRLPATVSGNDGE